jgi:creatinine amidohydrolase/Fe(II)-dependent formamide hydrolase-like protein
VKEMENTTVFAIGAVEQHGPAPKETDTIIVDKASEVLSRRLGIPRMPTLPYGYAEMFMDYQGTFSLEPETVIATIEDLLKSAFRQSFRRVIVLSSHDPNYPLLKTACSRSCSKFGLEILLFDIWNFPDVKKLVETETWHACEDEISVMEFLGYPIAQKIRELPEEMYMDYLKFPLERSRRSKSGVYGDLTKISASKGEKIFQTIIDCLESAVKKEWK